METATKFLRQTFQERREKNPSYSLNSFARDLGVSKSLLSRIFSGERAVSMKLAMQITTALDLDDARSKAIIYSVVEGASKNAKISKKIRAKMEKEKVLDELNGNRPAFTTVDMERFRAMASWHHLAILNLTKVKGFKNDPQWVAKRLGISTVEAQDGLERLVSIGLLIETGDTVKRSSESLYVKTSKSEFAVRKFHEQMIGKGLEELKNSDDKSFQKRLINGITLPCNPEHIELIKEKINRLQDELLSLITGDEYQDVYQMNVQFFPLTNERTGEDK